MEKLKSELGEKLNRITIIWLFAKDAYYFAEYFHNPDTAFEKDYIDNSRDKYHLDFMRHIMYRTLVIELSKLFCNTRNEQFNIFKFINSFKPGNYFSKLNLDINFVEKWEDQLKVNEKNIEKIVTLRDQYYAHDDDNATDISLLDIGFPEICNLLDLVWEILKKINGTLLDNHLESFASIFSNREGFHFLKTMAVADRRRTEEIMQQYQLYNHPRSLPPTI